MRTFHFVGVAVIGIAAPSTAENPPLALERTGAWAINYDANNCNIIGQFGEGTDQVSVRLTKSGIGDNFDLGLYGTIFESKTSKYPMTIDFGLAEKPEEVEALAGLAGQTPVIVVSTRLDGYRINWKQGMVPDEIERLWAAAPKITPQQEAKVSQLTATLPNKHSVQLKLGSMLGPMATLRACVNKLIRGWGYDPAVARSLRTGPKPIGNHGEWLKTEDYPKTALMRGRQAIIKFRLDVDADGSTVGCTVLQSTEPNEMNEITCPLLKRRAKFSPALDSIGQPVKSFYINTVRWHMP